MNDQQAADLVLQVRQGRTDAFEQLHRNFYADLRRFFTRVLWDDCMSERLTEEVLVKVWHRPDTFTANERVLIWILQLACTVLLSSQDVGCSAELTGGRASPPRAPAGFDDDVNMARRFATLNVRERIVVALTYQLRCCPEEIARITRSNGAHVKRLLFSALQKLRSGLEVNANRAVRGA
jgi:DNA-directed RNA polymerase specialized sigma24 family protein